MNLSKMLNLNECKKVLNEKEKLYTDEEILLIRDWMYHMADIAIDAMKERKNINDKQKEQR